MTTSAERLFAPSKLTVSLRITGVRHDGYHFIDAEMVTLDFGDELLVQPADQSVVVMTENGASTPAEPNNLVYQALALSGRTAHVEVQKNIPAGAGLGGGSADAGAILRWAGYNDVDNAARIGADVPFCIVGGRARVVGIGEGIEPLAFQARTFTLLTPPLHCSTPTVYAHWDRLGGPTGEHGNDLEPAALAAYPELEKWRDRLGEATGLQPRLAGSGSTWFVEGNFPEVGRVVSTIPSTCDVSSG